MHLDAHTDPARPIWRRPLFLAVAAALVVVAIVGAALATGDDGAVELDPADPVDLQDTGWYLPPEGWDIAEVRTELLDVGASGRCPCRTLIAADEGEQDVALVVREFAGPIEGLDGAVAVDVGGRPGQLADVGSDVLAVDGGEHHLLVLFSSVDPEVVVAVADAWLDRLEAGDPVSGADLPLPGELTVGEVVDVPDGRQVNVLDVLAVERSTGRRIYYQVVPPAAFYSALVIDADQLITRGQRFEILTSVGVTPMVALLGGPVDLVVGPSHFGVEGDDLTANELSTFLGGLRQASADGWRRAIGSAPAPPEVLQAETLFDMSLVDDPSAG